MFLRVRARQPATPATTKEHAGGCPRSCSLRIARSGRACSALCRVFARTRGRFSLPGSASKIPRSFFQGALISRLTAWSEFSSLLGIYSLKGSQCIRRPLHFQIAERRAQDSQEEEQFHVGQEAVTGLKVGKYGGGDIPAPALQFFHHRHCAQSAPQAKSLQPGAEDIPFPMGSFRGAPPCHSNLIGLKVGKNFI